MLGCRLEGWRWFGRYDLIVNWQDLTRDMLDVAAYVAQVQHEHPVARSGAPVLNAGPVDISKTKVEEAHRAAFGYGALVDPLTHQGIMVEKSDGNALHDGRVLEGPITADRVRPGSVYARYIDTRDVDGRPVDLRTPYFGKVAAQIMEKRFEGDPRETGRFGGRRHSRIIKPTGEAFSAEEIAGIERLVAHLGLDVCEMDVLRNREDGRIYVVDCNRTAAPASGPLTLGMEAQIYESMARDLLEHVIRPMLLQPKADRAARP